MIDYQEMLYEFHEKFGDNHPRTPGIPDDEEAILRMVLVNEESREVMLAVLERDIEHIAKELADLIYVSFGTACAYGIPMDKVFEEVHKSNMTKVWEDGTVKRRADGKIEKPPTYSPADLSFLGGDSIVTLGEDHEGMGREVSSRSADESDGLSTVQKRNGKNGSNSTKKTS